MARKNQRKVFEMTPDRALIKLGLDDVLLAIVRGNFRDIFGKTSRFVSH